MSVSGGSTESQDRFQVRGRTGVWGLGKGVIVWVSGFEGNLGVGGCGNMTWRTLVGRGLERRIEPTLDLENYLRVTSKRNNGFRQRLYSEEVRTHFKWRYRELVR